MPEISIIIVTYNPGKTILACLEALYKHHTDDEIEVIVVDNASRDDTVEQVRTHYPQVKLLACDDNLGYGVGNNRGFELATGEFVVILNPDVVVREGALTRMVEYLKQNPDVGVVAPKTFDEEHQPVISARAVYNIPRLFVKYFGLDRLFPQVIHGKYGQTSLTTREPLDVDWLQGAALMFPYEVFKILNGFDEAFFLFFEDMEICIRVHELGKRVIFLPTAEIEHVGSESVSRFPTARIRSYQISPLYYYRKRGQEGNVRILKVILITSLALKSSIRRVQNIVKPDEKRLEKARVEWQTISDVWGY